MVEFMALVGLFTGPLCLFLFVAFECVCRQRDTAKQIIREMELEAFRREAKTDES